MPDDRSAGGRGGLNRSASLRAVVVGAGPAGIAAVERLVAAGLRPVWIDEAPDGGGRIYQRPPPGFARDHRALYGADAPAARRAHAALDRLKPLAEWRPETLVWNIQPQLRQVQVLHRGASEDIAYDAIILCTGAMDRVLPVPGWTLPGVTTVGGAQIALKAQGCAIGRRVVLCGTGPLLYLLAAQLRKAGQLPVLVLDTTSLARRLRAAPALLQSARGENARVLLRGIGLLARLRLSGMPFAEGAVPLAIEGSGAVERFRWRDVAGREQVVACDAVALGWGLKPEAQLADLAGVPFLYEPVQQNWIPQHDSEGRTPVPGVFLAGDGRGIGGAQLAWEGGRRAAEALLAGAGEAPGSGAAMGDFRAALERAFPWPAALAAAIPDAAILCRCEAITAGELRAQARDAAEINRAKALSRLGMGRCQGRVCGPAGAAVLAAALGVPVEQAGRLRGQPPVKPIPVPAP